MASVRSSKPGSNGKARRKWRIQVVVRIDVLVPMTILVVPVLAALTSR